MPDKSYNDLIQDLAKATVAMLRGMAVMKVRETASTCSHYKIGKTGETLSERLNQPDYKDVYTHIKEVYSATNAHEASGMEASLIRQFIADEKCDNRKDGFASLSDSMKPAEKYSVYVVWND